MPAPMIFRFPGSKAKFLKTLTPFLDRLLQGRKSFHDVFTGGGAVALFVAERHRRMELRLNDLDPDLSAFWRVVAGHQVGALCDRLRIRPTIELFYELRCEAAKTDVDRAFRAVFFSRCCFSGLLHGNPLGGERQMSPNKVFTRYNGTRLIQQIRQAHKLLSGRTRVTRMDGAQYVWQHPTAPMYLDPPYFEKGDRLFRQRMTLADHLRLLEALRSASHWVLSYDRCPVISELYSWARCLVIRAEYSVSGKKTEWASNEELVITPGPDGVRPRRKRLI
jgi:DNA adenine methylase